jgi:hypothetical protein
MNNRSFNSLDEAIDCFFRDPASPPEEFGQFAILYRLRRDIIECFGQEPSTGARRRKIIFPGVMALLAGVDLMGKFYAGSDNTGRGEIGRRFRAYLNNFMGTQGDEDETLWQLRNSLLHSFGLYSRGGGKTYYFELVEAAGPLIDPVPGDRYRVNCTKLDEAWRASLLEYERQLRVDSRLGNHFRHMLPNYGMMVIEPIVISGITASSSGHVR